MRYLPNLITCLNLLTGAIGCFLIARGEIARPVILVFIAAFFDLMDGFVARRAGVSSPMGKELDSLADVVSFGLLPSFFMSQLIAEKSEGYLFFVGLSIVIFSALRLAIFNIDDRQNDKFIGLPTPANAIMICSISFLPENFLGLYGLIAITLGSCILLVSPLELLAFKFKNFHWRENIMKYLLLILVIILLVVFRWEALPLLVPVYIVFSLIGNFLNKNTV